MAWLIAVEKDMMMLMLVVVAVVVVVVVVVIRDTEDGIEPVDEMRVG